MQAIRDVGRRVAMMLARGVLAAVSDGGGLQGLRLRLLADEEKDGIERVQQYGLTSVPLAGAEAVIVFLGGNRDHGLVVAVDDRRYRLRGLRGGEVALYDDLGQSVHLTRDGIVIRGAGRPVTLTDAPTVRLETARLEVTGDVIDRCDGGGLSMRAMRAVYDAHTHPETGAVTRDPGQKMK